MIPDIRLRVLLSSPSMTTRELRKDESSTVVDTSKGNVKVEQTANSEYRR